MNKSYANIVKQIEKLQLEAAKLRRDEIADVVARIREAIAVYQLTAADLGLNPKTKGPALKAAAPIKRRQRKAGAKIVRATKNAKYSNGEGGAWAGVGKRPNWLREALAAGRQLSDFEVK